MPNISPVELRPGLVLADDVYNLDSKLLFAADTSLTEKQIEILMMWGVEHVAVKGPEHSPNTVTILSFSDTIKHSAEIAVQKRFKLVKSSHPAVLAMRAIAVLEAAKLSDRTETQS